MRIMREYGTVMMPPQHSSVIIIVCCEQSRISWCRYDRYDSWSLEPGACLVLETLCFPDTGVRSVYLDMHMLGVGSHATFPSITIDTAPAERNTYS